MRTGLIARLWRALSPRRKRQMGWLLAFTVVASVAEVFSIGVVFPFLAVLTAPERALEAPWARLLAAWVPAASPAELPAAVTVLFCAAAAGAAAVRVAALWMRTRLSFAAGADLSNEIYRRTLHQPYAVHLGRNSSAVIEGMSGKVNTVIMGVLHPLLVLASNGLMLAVMAGALLLYGSAPALAVLLGSAGLYWVVFRLSSRRLSANSRAIAASAAERVKLLQEGLGGIRDILLRQSQPVYCRDYARVDARLRRAQSGNLVMAEAPRYVIEAMGMGGIALVAYALVRRPGGVAAAVPLMGMLAVAGARVLPLLRQVYSALATLRGSEQSLADVLLLLEQPMPAEPVRTDAPPLPFARAIECRGVGFRYAPDGPWQLRDVSLVIPRGSRVGIAGTTGSGKSTLLDVIMALLPPEEGALLVDGCAVTPGNAARWQRRVAHVPQAIHLSDASVAENIALGVPAAEIDLDRVRAAAAAAQLDRAVASWPRGYDTLVGERGVRVSGGQRQRIGVARALYQGADVLVFDEATSALDMDTEAQVIRGIVALDRELTILMVAHRAQSLQACDVIIRVEGGRVVDQRAPHRVAAPAGASA